MTRDEHRSLDVQIAERLGWQKIRRDEHESHGNVSYGDWYGLSPQGNFERVPLFSSDADCAWGLIERIRLHLQNEHTVLVIVGRQVSVHYGGIIERDDIMALAVARLFLRASEQEDLAVHPSLRPFLGSVSPEEAAGIVEHAR